MSMKWIRDGMEMIWAQNVRAMIKSSSPFFSDGMRERCLERFDELLASEDAHQDFRLQNDREWKAKVDHQKARAEAAEAERDILNSDFTEFKRHALEALNRLLGCPSLADETHNDPEWGCKETAEAEAFARAVIAKASEATTPTL